MRCEVSINEKGAAPRKDSTRSQCWDSSSWWSEVVKVAVQVWGSLQPGLNWASLSLRGVLCHLSLWHTGQPCIYSQYLLYTQTWVEDKSISPGRLFCIHVCSLQCPIFLAVLFIGIMMLSESWCCEQKVQEKGGVERKITVSLGATSALWKKRCAGGEF